MGRKKQNKPMWSADRNSQAVFQRERDTTKKLIKQKGNFYNVVYLFIDIKD